MDSTETETVLSYYKRDLEQRNELKTRNEQFRKEYNDLVKILTDFPDKIRYDSMIPVTDVAFVPGTIEKTNEILVLLGDNYFVKCSAKQAIEIAKRREEYVSEKIQSIDNQISSIEEKLSLLPQQLDSNLGTQDEDFIEIKEYVDEEGNVTKAEKNGIEAAIENSDDTDDDLDYESDDPEAFNSLHQIESEDIDSLLNKEEEELLEMLRNAEINETNEFLLDDSFGSGTNSSLKIQPSSEPSTVPLYGKFSRFGKDFQDDSIISDDDLGDDNVDELVFENYDDDEDYDVSIKKANILEEHSEFNITQTLPEFDLLLNKNKTSTSKPSKPLITEISDSNLNSPENLKSILKPSKPKKSIFKEKKTLKQLTNNNTPTNQTHLASSENQPPQKRKSVSFSEINDVLSFEKHSSENTSDYLKPSISTPKNSVSQIRKSMNTNAVKNIVEEDFFDESDEYQSSDDQTDIRQIENTYNLLKKKIITSENQKLASSLADEVLSKSTVLASHEDIPSNKEIVINSVAELAYHEGSVKNSRLSTPPVVKSQKKSSEDTTTQPDLPPEKSKISKFKARRLNSK
ncbi:hypothetical protein BB560_001805 [Smittium megazygosporum]|uniref:DUF3835 domain-containing protein n=1 Tax=Smittium megazygosporum TaxID=133381 RepID=A0A2T9ZGN6_9FUNG|nr:hypothetical protein BB560_001805 [Smittium megazygosporum]